MKPSIFVLGSDANVLDTKSTVFLRQQFYAKETTETVIYCVGRGSDNGKIVKEGNLQAASFRKKSFIASWLLALKSGKEFMRTQQGTWIISAQDPFEYGLLAYLIAKSSNKPLHLQLHTDPDAPLWGDTLKNNIRRKIFSFLAPRADAFRVVSLRAKHAAEVRGAKTEAIDVIPIATDMNAIIQRHAGKLDIRKSYESAVRIVLAMGRLEYEKGFDILIDAFRRLEKKLPGTELFIVGSGSEESRLKKQIRDYGLSQSVHMIPWARDIAAYYKTSDCVVVPSRYEGWGLVAIEAAYFAKPIVMTDVGCAGEIIRHEREGLVVDSNDVVALSDSIVRIFSEKGLAKKLGDGAKEAVASLATPEETAKLQCISWEKAYRRSEHVKKTI